MEGPLLGNGSSWLQNKHPKKKKVTSSASKSPQGSSDQLKKGWGGGGGGGGAGGGEEQRKEWGVGCQGHATSLEGGVRWGAIGVWVKTCGSQEARKST